MAPPSRRRWRQPLRIALALAVIAGLAGAGFAALGAYNIAASTGHWAITERLLRFGLWRSVAVRAPDEAPMPLKDSDLIRLGAGHFEQGCATCHGAPGRTADPVTRTMLPAPPPLHREMLEWSDGELFFIVRHGIKYTGMPAWPVEDRDDEVWSVVAFLRALPDLTPDHYATLAGSRGRQPQGLERDADAQLSACAACHGDGAEAPSSRLVPRLQGQSESVLRNALDDYADGRRASGIMRLAATPLTAQDRAALARHYAALAPLPPAPADEALVQAGARLATQGDRENRVPACLSCHGPAARPDFPRLEGQNARYLAQRLRLWNEAPADADTSAWAQVMAPIARRLNADQIDALAAYFSAQDPRPRTAASGTAGETAP